MPAIKRLRNPTRSFHQQGHRRLLLNVEREKVKFVRPRKVNHLSVGRKKSGSTLGLVKPVAQKRARNNIVDLRNVSQSSHQRPPLAFPPALKERRLVESPLVKEQRLYARRDK